MNKALILGIAFLLVNPAQAAEWKLDQLMDKLAQTRSGHAAFVEKKTLAILDKPVESSGELFYRAPDRLEKRTLKPKYESMLLETGTPTSSTLTSGASNGRGTLTINQQGRRERVLQLQSYPELAAFIDSIRATLAGDRAALERSYSLTFTGDERHWTLELRPQDSRMQKVVEKIVINGEQDILHSIAISQANGDSSIMTITPLPPS
jgi:hypothetical protein